MPDSIIEPCFQHIVPASYDRSPSLTKLEKYALAEVAKRAHQSRSARKSHLTRLVQPGFRKLRKDLLYSERPRFQCFCRLGETVSARHPR